MYRSTLTLLAIVALSNCAKEEHELIKKLLASSDPNTRPSSGPTEPISVNVDTYLISVRDFDETRGVVTIGAWIGFTWNDTNLSWKPSDNSKIKKVVIPSNLIWTPDVFLESEKGLNEERLRGDHKNDMSVQSTGEVYYLRSVKVTLPLQKTDKGFETNFLLEPWYSDKTLQVFHANSKTMDVHLLTENAKYALKSNTVTERSIVYPDTPDETYSAIEVKLSFSKK